MSEFVDVVKAKLFLEAISLKLVHPHQSSLFCVEILVKMTGILQMMAKMRRMILMVRPDVYNNDDIEQSIEQTEQSVDHKSYKLKCEEND